MTALTMKKLDPCLEVTQKIQTLFESAPMYFQAIGKNQIPGDEAEKTLTMVPGGFPLQKKYGFGFYHHRDLVGFVDILRGYPAQDIAYLGLLLISEIQQGSGLGRRVFTLLEDQVGKWPEVSRIRLGVASSNDVCGYWEKMGFHKTGHISKCNEPEITCDIIEMEK